MRFDCSGHGEAQSVEVVNVLGRPVTSDAVVFNELGVCWASDKSGHEFSFAMCFKTPVRGVVVITITPLPLGLVDELGDPVSMR